MFVPPPTLPHRCNHLLLRKEEALSHKIDGHHGTPQWVPDLHNRSVHKDPRGFRLLDDQRFRLRSTGKSRCLRASQSHAEKLCEKIDNKELSCKD